MMEVTFPGGLGVDVSVRGHTVATDQPLEAGGRDRAPSPYELFLASLAACAGYYVLRFCRGRGIGTAGLKVTLDSEPGEAKKLGKVVISIALPEGFPREYRDAVVKAAESCAVKKAMEDTPEFEVKAV